MTRYRSGYKEYDYKYFWVVTHDTGFYFRFFNKWGLSVEKIVPDMYVPFSKRGGLKKVYKAFGWMFYFLK